jgi:hypothetical protein
MKLLAIFYLLLLGHSFCLADDFSGPNHTTIKRGPWGCIFYDPMAWGPHDYEYKLDDIRIKSNSREVRLIGSEISGYKLRSGKDELTINSTNFGFEIRWHEKTWTIRNYNSQYTLISNSPKDRIVFERNANSFSIKGMNGFSSVNSNPWLLSIKSSAGDASIKKYLSDRSFSGIPIDQLPYFGRGVYISFHGVGILIDMLKLFPRSEVSEWIEWKPLIGLPFDSNAD